MIGRIQVDERQWVGKQMNCCCIRQNGNVRFVTRLLGLDCKQGLVRSLGKLGGSVESGNMALWGDMVHDGRRELAIN